MRNALGMVETNSIPKGIEAGDAMLKAAQVELTAAQTACAGKYIVIVSGDVAAVKASVEAGCAAAADAFVDMMMIPNVDPQVLKAISACTQPLDAEALGIIETFSLSSAILCADQAVKAANISLIEIRLGRGLGGKSFVTLTGDVAAVNHAVKVASECEETKGMMARSVVIPSPHPDLIKAVY
jgi:microcompartment protein CcmL/EutN